MALDNSAKVPIETSIVMTAYRRASQLRYTLDSIFRQNTKHVEVIVVEDGFDGGKTMDVCANFFAAGCQLFYIRRNARPKVDYSNQAIPLNIGIRRARGDVLIIQNAECRHITTDVIESLTEPHRKMPRMAVFAACLRVDEESEPSNIGSPYFFCGSIRRESVMKLGGFDEDFVGWGAEDCDFGNRMRRSGIRFEWRRDILVHHQRHELANREKCGYAENVARMEAKLVRMSNGESFEANVGRAWGKM